MKNILIIGNGFDLAHNIPTSYNHFLKYLVDNNSAINKEYIVDNSDRQFHKVSNKAYIKKDPLRKYVISSKNLFLIAICKEVNSNNWCDIEELYFRKLKVSTESNITVLNKEFKQIQNLLEEYLDQLPLSNSIESFSQFFKYVENEGETLCVNFNYTNTLNELYANNFEYINIHGSLKNIDNPIIFGYSATEIENEELLNKENNEFLKNIKTYHYNRTPVERRINEILSKKEEVNVYLIGHSCGMSDVNVLNRILSIGNMRKIELLYYKNYDNFFDSLINIRRVLGSNSNFDKVVNYSESLKCPQHNDLQEDIDGFMSLLLKK